MTRLRYSKNVSGLQVSKQVLAGPDLVTATLDTDATTFSVTTVDGKHLASGEADSVVNLKYLVRHVLSDLGVQFSEEIRQSKASELYDAEVTTEEKEVA